MGDRLQRVTEIAYILTVVGIHMDCQNPSDGAVRTNAFYYREIIPKNFKEKNVRHILTRT